MRVAPCRSTAQPTGAVSQEDRAYMLQALELAKRALGKTHPNPAVGCVIVKDGQHLAGATVPQQQPDS
ncbi:hypothetical protein OEZ85_009527 [Tetradesmus obliquus]|uniref:CMP/dCMP-type deaminase domain-containing protein n=1 Tax=Tetradesmus obliquus TaxID=3088 RepID=A0ABY8U9Q6_TETOB|nr:hypothetical protein OEZ85_009527 [Tetradesmus obliquus]